VFRLLRISRADLSPDLFGHLMEVATASESSALQVEAERIQRGRAHTPERVSDAPDRAIWFRRLKGQRTIQVALDSVDREQAVSLASVLEQAGVRAIEVGDPLIKRYGAPIIGELRRAAPSVMLVAEMVSTDWSSAQVE